MDKLLVGMDLVQQGPLNGPACRWIDATADLVGCFFRSAKIRFILRAVVLASLFPLKFLDLILNRLPTAMDHSISLYAIYRKR